MTESRNGQRVSERTETRLTNVLATAMRDFEMITGRRVESVSSVKRHDGGWSLCLEVVELRRVPDSTSILGTYETHVDREGGLIEYERTGRYYRNQASDMDTL